MIVHDPDVFQQSVDVSLRRLDAIRGRLYAEFSAVATAVDVTPDRVEIDHRGLRVERIMSGATGVHPDTAPTTAGVREMVRVTLAFFVFIGSAVAGLFFGSPNVQMIIGVALLLGAAPLYFTMRRILEASAAAQALRYAADCFGPGRSHQPTREAEQQ